MNEDYRQIQEEFRVAVERLPVPWWGSRAIMEHQVKEKLIGWLKASPNDRPLDITASIQAGKPIFAPDLGESAWVDFCDRLSRILRRKHE